MTLPKACPKPCNDCPWRVNALPGWLGPLTAAEWIRLAGSDEPIACHETIKDTNDEGEGDWSDPRMRQCAGAAIYRRNTGKLVRNPEDASNTATADREAVFSHPGKFMEHHGANPADLLVMPPVMVDHLDKHVDKREDPCDGCPDDEAEWECTLCRGHYCNGCIDAFGSQCPECLTDPGWMPLDDEGFDDDDDMW